MKQVLVFGATSAIAESLLRKISPETSLFYLIGRNTKRLEALASDLNQRYKSKVKTAECDFCDIHKLEMVTKEALNKLGTVDMCIVAHGILGDQQKAEEDPYHTKEIIDTNYTSYCVILNLVAQAMESKKNGQLVVFSSVAGDRGRKKNYVYGSAKAGVNLFVQGLRHRLALCGVEVSLIKPGMVDTPMTAQMPRSPLLAKADTVAWGIHKALKQKKVVAYVPWFWRYIMLVVREIPFFVFKRLNF